MQIEAAQRMATELMARHGLVGWRLVLDNAKRRAGVCRAARREIGLSRVLTALHSEAEVRDTVLHEIAHALVGVEHGHNAVWRAKARAIGCSGERCLPETAPRADAPWTGTCPAGHLATRHRRPSRVQSCAACSRSFDPGSLITWLFHGEAVPMPPAYQAELARITARYGGVAAGPAAAASGGGVGEGVGDGMGEAVAARASGPASGPSATPGTRRPQALLPVGTDVRIHGTGRYAGVVGTIVKRGRTRYHVSTGVGVLTAPFELVEATEEPTVGPFSWVWDRPGSIPR